MRYRKRTLLAAVLLVAVFFIARSASVFSALISRSIEGRAARAGVGLQIEELSLGISPQARAVKFWTRTMPTVTLSKITLRPSWLDLIMLRPSLSLDAEYLQGLLSISANQEGAERFVGSAEIKDSVISLVPILETFSFEGGKMQIKLDSFVFEKQLVSALGTASLSNLQLVRAVSLPTFLTKLPFSLEIPAFNLNSAAAIFNLHGGILDISSLQAESDQLSAKGEISTVINGRRSSKGTLCIKLSENGVKSLGQFLQLVGGVNNTESQLLSWNGGTTADFKIKASLGCP